MAAKPENKKDNPKAISRKRAKSRTDKKRNSRKSSGAQEISFRSDFTCYFGSMYSSIY